MTKKQAIAHLNNVGLLFAERIKEQTGETLTASPLMIALMCYKKLNLKGRFRYLDESVNTVAKIVYEASVKASDKALKKLEGSCK